MAATRGSRAGLSLYHNLQRMMLPQAGPEAAHKLINFINASPTPYHAVRNAATRLEQAGFRKVRLSPFSPLSSLNSNGNIDQRS